MSDIIKAFFVAFLIALTISCSVARYNECRKVHPFWYCIGQK